MEHIADSLNRGLLRAISNGLVALADDNWRNGRAAQKLRDAAASILDAEMELQASNFGATDETGITPELRARMNRG